MQEHVIELIKMSFVPDSQTLRHVTSQMEELAKQSGFCPAMMLIADTASNDLPVRQAALVQFKNAARKYWNSTAFQIQMADKNQIISSLVNAFVRVAGTPILLNLYREIMTLIIGFEYTNWMPTEVLVEKLSKNSEDSIAVLHMIIAISTNFEFCINDEERDHYYKFLLTILPCLFDFVKRNQNQQIIYLALKVVWKCVHYEINHEVRNAICNWMELVLTIAGATNAQLEKGFEQTQAKGTPEFFYFHAKKWATRILHRFISRHANTNQAPMASEKIKKINAQFSKAWYDNFGSKVVETITNQFLVPSIKKTRFHQIKCLTGLVGSHPTVMKTYAQKFQYQILLTFMQLQPEDQEIANNDPIEFMNRQEDPTLNYTNLKKVAVDAWISFSNIGSKRKSKGKSEEVGMFFYDNMNFLKAKLEGSNPLDKEMAMYLICQLRMTINSCEEIKKIIPNLVSHYVIPEFTNQIMFLRARAMEIFNEYGDLTYSPPVLKKAVQGIYFCLTQDNYPLVRLKAATAFHILLRHQQAKEEVKPLFQQILQIYLILVEKYDLESLVASLGSIVEHFSVEVGPYSCELMRYLSKHFVKLYHKDNAQSQNTDYDGETELAAAGILNTMKILLESPIEKESIDKMEEDIAVVFDFIFSADENTDYIEDALMVLKAYTHRCSAISERILFYYVLVIYYVMGIPAAFWDAIPNLMISEAHRKGLMLVKSGCNVEALESVMPVLRNYISKDSSLLFRLTDPFGVNLLELLFQMVSQIYSKGPDEFDGEIEMNSCTILMVYLVENNIKKCPEPVINHIWEVVKFNLQRAKSHSLKALNAQLICVLIWNSPEYILSMTQQANLLQAMCQHILNSKSKIIEEHQRQRIIFGICEFLLLPDKPADTMKHIPQFFNLLIHLIERNCDVRLDDEDDQNYHTESDEEDEQALLEQFAAEGDFDEPENMWEEDFERNYSSNLDEMDEIKHFKESMQKLQAEQPEFCGKLFSIVPAEKLGQLNQKMDKAMQVTASGLQ